MAVDATACDRYPNSGIAKVTDFLYRHIPAVDASAEVCLIRRPPISRTPRLPIGAGVTAVVAEVRGTGVFTRWDIWQELRLPLEAWRLKSSVLHCLGNDAPLLGRVPTVVHVHDTQPLDFCSDPKAGRAWVAHVAKRIERAAAIVTHSEYTRGRLCDVFGVEPEQVAVVPWAPTLSRPGGREATPSDAARMPFVVAFGSVARNKNSEGLLKAWGSLDPRLRRQCRLKLVGLGGGDMALFARMVTDLGLQASTELLGPVPDADLSELLGRATALCYPSLGEGFGLPVLEGLAMGTTVITSNVSSLPEVGGDAVVYCDPLSRESLAEALARTLTDQALRDGLRQRGELWLQRFSWSTTATSIVGILRSV